MARFRFALQRVLDRRLDEEEAKRRAHGQIEAKRRALEDALLDWDGRGSQRRNHALSWSAEQLRAARRHERGSGSATLAVTCGHHSAHDGGSQGKRR